MKLAYDGLLFLNREKITAGAFAILLLLKLGSSHLWGEYAFFYEVLIALPLLLFVGWVNQKSRGALRIDKLFLSILTLSCFLLCFYYWDSPLEFVLIASLLFLYGFLLNQNISFEKDAATPKLFNLMFVALNLLILALFATLSETSQYFQNLFSLGINRTTWALATTLWIASTEVMLFFGVAWAVLRKMGIGAVGSIVLQASLFCLVYASAFSFSAFWIIIPMLGLGLGYLTLQSKSLTTTTVTYFTCRLIMVMSYLWSNPPQ